MKGTAIALLVILAVMMGGSLLKGNGAFNLGMRSSVNQLLRFLPVLVVAMLLIGFVEVLLPQALVEKWLSDAAGWRGIAVAWLAGILTPGGSIIGMPLVAGLYKAGVGTGVLVTYLTSLALMSVIRVPMEVGFYGWRLTSVRIAATVLLPPIAGVLAQVAAPFILKR